MINRVDSVNCSDATTNLENHPIFVEKCREEFNLCGGIHRFESDSDRSRIYLIKMFFPVF